MMRFYSTPKKSGIYLVEAKATDCWITHLLRREETFVDDLLITLSKFAAILRLKDEQSFQLHTYVEIVIFGGCGGSKGPTGTRAQFNFLHYHAFFVKPLELAPLGSPSEWGGVSEITTQAISIDSSCIEFFFDLNLSALATMLCIQQFFVCNRME